MTRALAAGLLTQVQAVTNRPILLFAGVFSGSTVRFWSGYGDRVWDGNTYTGAGHLIGSSPVEEATDIRAARFTVTLSGIPSSLTATVLTNTAQGGAGKVWFGALDASGVIVADPFLIFQGRLDVPSVEDAGETLLIRVSYESRLIDLQRPRDRRYTQEDQQVLYPGDLGFQYVEDPQDKRLLWS